MATDAKLLVEDHDKDDKVRPSVIGRRSRANSSSNHPASPSINASYSELDAVGNSDDRELSGAYGSFVSLRSNVSYPSDEASIALDNCRKFVIRPYDILLTLIGWRKFQTDRERCSGCISCLNVVYPMFIFTMLVVACIAQVSSCFSRTKSNFTQEVGINDTKYTILSCDDHLITLDGISYVLVLFAYLLALYVFRVADPDNLSSLAQIAFLSFNNVASSKSRNRSFCILVGILVCGGVFFCASTVISICRLFSLRLHRKNTIIGWFSDDIMVDDQKSVLRLEYDHYTIARIVLVSVAYCGFLFFDLLFIAVTINYCSQCQLLTYYIDNIKDKVRNNKYKEVDSFIGKTGDRSLEGSVEVSSKSINTNGPLHLAMQDIHKVYQFLRTLNGYVSTVASLIFLIFLSNLFLSYSSLVKPHQSTLNIITAFLNTFQWLVAALFPVLLAVRVNISCDELRRLGQEIATRPFHYRYEVSDLDLHFFLTFTESTRYEVYLAFIPMRPTMVLGFVFTVLLLISSGVVITQVESVSWF